MMKDNEWMSYVYQVDMVTEYLTHNICSLKLRCRHFVSYSIKQNNGQYPSHRKLTTDKFLNKEIILVPILG